MEIRMALLDQDETRAKRLRAEVTGASVRMDFDYRLIYISDERGVPAHMSELQNAHIVLFAADFPGAEKLGARLSTGRPELLTGFHGDGCSMAGQKLLPSRPCAALDSAGNADYQSYVAGLAARWIEQTAFFRWSTRFMELCLPAREILYFSSQNRYVSIVTANGAAGKLNATLDDVEKHVDPALFTRIHKSFLVNDGAVIKLDRGLRQVTLENHETLPVSDANYRRALEKLPPDFSLSRGKNT